MRGCKRARAAPAVPAARAVEPTRSCARFGSSAVAARSHCGHPAGYKEEKGSYLDLELMQAPQNQPTPTHAPPTHA